MAAISLSLEGCGEKRGSIACVCAATSAEPLGRLTAVHAAGHVSLLT